MAKKPYRRVPISKRFYKYTDKQRAAYWKKKYLSLERQYKRDTRYYRRITQK